MMFKIMRTFDSGALLPVARLGLLSRCFLEFDFAPRLGSGGSRGFLPRGDLYGGLFV